MSLYLVDHCYANDRLALIFYDDQSQQFKFWQRPDQTHFSYSYILNENGEGDQFIQDHMMDDDFLSCYRGHENEVLYHPLLHRQALFTRVDLQSPRDVSTYMSDNHFFENHIKYYTRFAIDEKIDFGMPYTIEQTRIRRPKVKPTPAEKRLRQRLIKKFDKNIVDDLLRLLIEPVPQMPYIAIDVEVLPRGNVVPSPALATEPILSAALLFRTLDDFFAIQLCLKEEVRGKIDRRFNIHTMKDIRAGKYTVEWFEDERDLIKRFFELLQDPRFRLVITFNGDNFDLQYLYNRARFLGLWTPLRYRKYTSPGGRIYHDVHIEPKDLTNQLPDMSRWKLHLDLYKFFSQTHIKNYAFLSIYTDNSLETICQALLGNGKVPLDKPIGELSVWDLIHYNMQDVFLLDGLMQMNNNQVLSLIFLLMRLGIEPLGECHRKAISSKIEHLIQKWVTRFNWVSPRRMDMRVQDEVAYEDLQIDMNTLPDKYKGAKVIDPLPGSYFNVECRDFTGLYTNTIANKNLSFETVHCGHPECKNNIVPEVGHYVCTRERGIMSQIVGLITTARRLYFKPMAKKDVYYSPIEQVLKVYGNATYGVFGATFFPYYLRILAESITAYSRNALERLIQKAKELGMLVLYGDTDSIFISGTDPEKMKELVEWVEKELGLELSLEYDLSLFCISHRKKNYFGIRKDGSPIVKGFKIKKRTSPPIITKIGNKVIELLAKAHDETELIFTSKTVVILLRASYNKIWRKEGEITDYAFTTQVTKPIKEYKTISAHVRAAIMEAEALLSELPEGVSATAEDIIQPGTLQSYIKCNLETVRRPSGRGHRIGVLPLTMATTEDVEPSHYHREMISSVAQIVEPLDIKPDDYITRDPNKPTLDQFMVTT